MEKILITLKVPSVQLEQDVMIPDFLPVKEIIKLLTEAVVDLTQNMYISSGEEVLCRKAPDMVLNERYTLQDYGVEHGETLYLF